MTKLYIMIGVWMTLTFKVTGLRESLNFYSHSVVKLHEAAQIFLIVDNVREKTQAM